MPPKINHIIPLFLVSLQLECYYSSRKNLLRYPYKSSCKNNLPKDITYMTHAESFSFKISYTLKNYVTKDLELFFLSVILRVIFKLKCILKNQAVYKVNCGRHSPLRTLFTIPTEI